MFMLFLQNSSQISCSFEHISSLIYLLKKSLQLFFTFTKILFPFQEISFKKKAKGWSIFKSEVVGFNVKRCFQWNARMEMKIASNLLYLYILCPPLIRYSNVNGQFMEYGIFTFKVVYERLGSFIATLAFSKM